MSRTEEAKYCNPISKLQFTKDWLLLSFGCCDLKPISSNADNINCDHIKWLPLLKPQMCRYLFILL